jgi:hypothetical protein
VLTPNLDDKIHHTTRLIPTEADGHPPECGTRIACPVGGHHDLGAYQPAERQSRRLEVIVRCHVCRKSWREVAA